MSELFNDMQSISQTAEYEQKHTPEDEAFRLAKSFIPKNANTLKNPTTIAVEKMEFERIMLIRLARFINPALTQESILLKGVEFCEDYNDTYNDDYDLYWFDRIGINLFLKWCSNSNNNTLFNN